MIVYRGISITDVAPVEIADIVVGTVKRNAVTSERPTRPGVNFVRITDNIRTVAITIADLTNDEETRLAEIDAINAWAAGDEPGRLVLPYRDGKYLDAVCTQYIEPSYRQWWETKLKLTFTAYDPYFNDPAERTAALGTAVRFTGSAEPLIRIETTLAAAASELEWTDGTNTLTLSGEIPAGKITVNLNRQTVTDKDGNSLSSLITLASRFPEITRVMNISCDDGGNLVWRERYV